MIEEESAAGEAAGEAFAAGLESLLAEGLIADAVVAGSEAQAQGDLARARGADGGGQPARAHPQVRRDGAAGRRSPPSSARWRRWPRTFDGMRAVLFGHLGDGNVHVNMAQEPGLADTDFRATEPDLAEAIYGAVHGRGG